jgi:uncharacterized protein YndB with AHSA1/START domain
MSVGTIQATIRHATRVRGDAGRVYAAFANASGLDAWFTTGSEVQAVPGGTIIFRWLDWGPDAITVEDRGIVLAADPGRRFSFEWGAPPTTVDITFEPDGDSTVVRLSEDGFPDTPEGLERMLDCAAGWGEALTLVKFYVEHGITTKR